MGTQHLFVGAQLALQSGDTITPDTVFNARSKEQDLKRRSLRIGLPVCILLILSLSLLSNPGRPLMFLSLQVTSWCNKHPSTCGRRQCTLPQADQPNETRQVVFIKVHKAASSTLQNILLRFTTARNLTALLPLHGPIFSQTSPVFPSSDVLPHPEGKAKFDILCSHVIYDKHQLEIYFAESAPRVAILREPLQQAVSALKYYTTAFHSKQLEAGLARHGSDPINGFLQHPEDFCNKECQNRPQHSFVNNRMSVDLGFSLTEIESASHNWTVVQDFLQKIEKEMDLVLISDYFDESMVLLRRTLHWPMKDIIYLKVNTSPHIQNTAVWNGAPVIDSRNTTSFRQWAFYDYALYDHFLTIFLKKLESECLFQEEVSAYKLIINDVVEFCKNATADADLPVQAGEWNEAFYVTAFDCDLMATNEVEMVGKARRIQIERNRTNTLKMLKNVSRKFGPPLQNITKP